MPARIEEAPCDGGYTEMFETPTEKHDSKKGWSLCARLPILKGRTRAVERGGWKTMPFILGTDICNMLAGYGLSFSMILYLTEEYNMQTVMAANVLNFSSGTGYITPLIGGYLADAYWGRFWTLIVASCINFVGMFVFVLSALIPSLTPCASTASQCSQSSTLAQLLFLYTAFALIAISSGGIKPCAYPFGGDQFDQTTLEGRKSFQSYSNWYFSGVFLSVVIGGYLFVYMQEKFSWAMGFSVLTIALAISIVLLVMGTSLYKFETPAGSPFKQFAQVCIAAFSKRKLTLPRDSADLLDLLPRDGVKLIHTDHFRSLDKAAIITEEDLAFIDGKVSDPWRICTVHQVEQLKLILRTVPIMISSMLNIMAVSQQTNFCVLQGTVMNRHVFGSFQLPVVSITLIAFMTIAVFLPVYDNVVLPIARRVTGNDRGVSFLQRIGMGFCIAAVGLILSGIVECVRRKLAIEEGLIDDPSGVVDMSILWLLPQLILFGLGEALYGVGIAEFFYDQVPEGMRSTASSLNSAASGLGSYFSSLLLTIVQQISARGGQVGWLDDNLNRGRLDYYYYLVGGIIVANLLYFLVVSNWYSYKTVVVLGEDGGDDNHHDHVES